MTYRSLLLSLSLVGMSCAPDAAVWVRIEAPLKVPEQCDTVELRARRLDDSVLVYSAVHDLAARGVQFPVELALSTSDDRNVGAPGLTLEVEAKLKGERATSWASAQMNLELPAKQWTVARVALCDCEGAAPP